MKLITSREINQDYKDKLLLFLDKEVDQVHFEVFEEPLTEESVIQHNHGSFYRCYKFQEWRYSLFLSISKNKYLRWELSLISGPFQWDQDPII